MQNQVGHSKKQNSSILLSSLKIILGIAMITAMSCKKDDGKSNDPFVSCCTYDATTFKDGDRKYAIPTIVTDNMDGTNDGFVILTNAITGKDTIVSLRIFDDKNVLIFELSMQEIELKPYVWDGKIASGPDIGERYRGAFSYECIIRGPSGPDITINGKACIVSDYCEVKEENSSKCVLATQHTGGGDFNTDLHSLEACE